MTIDIKGLNDNLLKSTHNYDEFSQKWAEFMAAPAGDVVFEYYDRNGNLQTKTIPNRAKLVDDLTIWSRNFKNKIINGDFSVWQRGTAGTGATNKTFTADRWAIFGPTGDITFDWIRVAADNDLLNQNLYYGLKIQKTAGADPLVLYQFIENLGRFIPREKVTISFYAKTTTATTPYNIEVALQATIGRFTETTPEIVSQQLTVDNTLKKITVTLTVPNYLDTNYLPSFNWGQLENTALILKIRIPNPGVLDDLVLSGVQLEKGTVATNFEHIPYDIQLQRCMRYYEVIENAIAWKAPVTDDTYGYVNFKIRKRAVPTIGFIRPSDGQPGADYYYDTGSDILNAVGVFHVSVDGTGFGNGAYTPPSSNDARLVTNIHVDAEL